MRYGPLIPYVGARPMQDYFLPANDLGFGVTGISTYGGPGSTPPFMPPGCIVSGFDNYWGGVEFMYVQANGTINAWNLVQIIPAVVSGRFQFQATQVANTANQARPVGVAIQQMATGQFGWVAVSGLVPVNCTASVAANTVFGIAAAGQGGASAAGKEIENAVVILPATTTVSKSVLLTSGSPIVLVTGNNTIDGLFVGTAVSGTGIPANAVVASLNEDGRRFTMSTGPGVTGAALNATASGGITLTGTYNDGTNFYNIAQLGRPFAQGRIT